MKHRTRCLIVCGIVLALMLAACSSKATAPPEVVGTWQPPAGTEAVMVASCEEIRSLFAYDSEAPLDIQERNRQRGEGVTVIDLTYASPMGGQVPTTLVIPGGDGPFAGLLIQHGMGGDIPPSPPRKDFISLAETYARMGALVILIDAPFARPEHQGRSSLMFTKQDRREQIQLIIDLRRAVDLLLSRPEVDPHRLAYLGISYGGAMGGLLAGVEDRLQGYVLVVGDGGLVTHVTGPEDMEWWLAKPEEVRQQWQAWMWPVEPIHFVGCAAPSALLFQNGTLDESVPPADGLRYQQAGSEPKTVRWYKAGHSLSREAYREQAEWLGEIIGLAGYRNYPPRVEIVLAAWFLMTAGSLAFLVGDLWFRRPAPWGARLLWLLTTVFLGPLGLAIYWISYRHSVGAYQLWDARDSSIQSSASRRALASAGWSCAGNLSGGIVVLGLLIYYPNVFSNNLILQIVTTILLPLCAGWTIFAASRWISRTDIGYLRSYQRSLPTEIVSTYLILAGLYPTFNVLGARFLYRWTYPFGFDLYDPPVWGILSLAGLVGILVAYPFHLWMIRRGVIRWGVAPEEDDVRGLAWYSQAALFLFSFSVMLAAILLSIQIA